MFLSHTTNSPVLTKKLAKGQTASVGIMRKQMCLLRRGIFRETVKNNMAMG